MTATGSGPGDFVELDLEAVENIRSRSIHDALAAAARELSIVRGTELRVAVIDGNHVLVDDDGVRFQADVTRTGRLELTAVLSNDLL